MVRNVLPEWYNYNDGFVRNALIQAFLWQVYLCKSTNKLTSISYTWNIASTKIWCAIVLKKKDLWVITTPFWIN